MSLLDILKRIDEEMEVGDKLVKEFITTENNNKRKTIEPNTPNEYIDHIYQSAHDRLVFTILSNKRLRLDMKINKLRERLNQ